MDKSAIILAGGFSRRFGSDKGLVPLANKPLIRHVLDAVSGIVKEEIVVVSSERQAENFAKVLSANVKIAVDKSNLQSPIVGALTGFEMATCEYALLLPCDTPLVSKDALKLLSVLCAGRNAAIPRWPSGYIEPLQAAYRVKPSLEAAEKALNEGRRDMRSMIDKLGGVRYVSTIVFQQLDPELKMFFNVNTPLDLKKAELTLKSEKGKRSGSVTSSF